MRKLSLVFILFLTMFSLAYSENFIIDNIYHNESFLFVNGTSGAVGVGTFTPNSRLNIYDAGGVDNKLRFNSPTTGNLTTDGTRIGLNGLEFFVNNLETSDIKLYTDSDQAKGIVIRGSTGYVGIGATVPAAKLDVASSSILYPSINSETGAIFSRTGSAGQNNYVSIISGNTGNAALFFGDTDNQVRGQIVYANNGDSMRFITSGSEVVRIDSSGNVGIGTSQPNSTLHVDGVINVTSGNDICISGGNCLSNVGSEVDTLQTVTSRGATSNVRINVSNNFVVDTNTFFVNSTSNRVGIGTTSPSGKLHVVGGNTYLDGERVYLGGNSNNGVINNQYSIRINIDSDNSALGECFI